MNIRDYLNKAALYFPDQEVLVHKETRLTARQLGEYAIKQEQRCIELRGEPVKLTQKEFELASYMFQNPGKLLSRVHLLEKLWGLNAEVDTRTVDTHVSRIRRKLAIKPENGWQIVPEYGWGYRIERLDSAGDA